jgi:uncharacterized protein (TIGR00369 family)
MSDHGDAAADDLLPFAQRVLAAQPFSRLLGARITAFGGGAATLELDTRDDLRQQHGQVHGGVLAYAADNAITFAAGTVLGANIVTAGMTIDYCRPAGTGLLRARAIVLASSPRRATCRCEISCVDGDGGEMLCAVAQGSATLTGPPRQLS